MAGNWQSRNPVQVLTSKSVLFSLHLCSPKWDTCHGRLQMILLGIEMFSHGEGDGFSWSTHSALSKNKVCSEKLIHF